MSYEIRCHESESKGSGYPNIDDERMIFNGHNTKRKIDSNDCRSS